MVFDLLRKSGGTIFPVDPGFYLPPGPIKLLNLINFKAAQFWATLKFKKLHNLIGPGGSHMWREVQFCYAGGSSSRFSQ